MPNNPLTNPSSPNAMQHNTQQQSTNPSLSLAELHQLQAHDQQVIQQMI